MPWSFLLFSSDYFLQLASLLRDPIYQGVAVPDGQGQPVMLIPGFMGGDWTLFVLAGWLNRMGYRAYFSGIHWHVDCPNKTGEWLRWRLEHIITKTGKPVIVIGHSLGGTLARFLGANFPEKVNKIVALGSPLDPTLRIPPLVLRAFQVLRPLRLLTDRPPPACGSARCACQFARTAFSPLPEGIGFTSIFTKQDRIVPWTMSVSHQGDNKEVSGGHIGLIVNRQAYRILADILADEQPHASGLDQSTTEEEAML